MRLTARELRMIAQSFPSGSAEYRVCEENLQKGIDQLKCCALVTNVLESELKVIAPLMAVGDCERIEYKGGFRPVYAIAVIVTLPSPAHTNFAGSVAVPTFQALSPRGNVWWIAGHDAVASALLEMLSRPPGVWLEPAVWLVKESPLGGCDMPVLQRSNVRILGDEGT